MVGDPSCKECGGTGVRQKDDFTNVRCRCNVKIQIQNKLGPEIGSAPLIEGGLYETGTSWPSPKRDRTRENLFLQGPWLTLLGHFRWAFTCKLIETGLRFHWVIITDERIKNIYVGNEHFRAKTRDEGEREESHNGLPDIMGGHDLVIVRLGFLGHKNRSAGGGLWEALMLREIERKPTWVVDHPDRPYNSEHLSYSPEASHYIQTYFQTVDLHPKAKEQTVHSNVPSLPITNDLSAEDEAARPSVEDESDFVIHDPVVTEGPKKYHRSWKHKNKGTGPV